MERRKLKITLSLAVLIPCVLYIAGIIAQFMININAWKAAGSDYSVSPGLPSLELADVFRSIFHFPEGLIAIGVVVVGIVLICIFGLRIGWGQNGVTDSDRNLTVSSSGSYGTASFMSPKEASACFDVTSAKKTEQDILGMLPDGQILTLPKNTRLNSNLAVCGSSGTGKSRSISRNLVLQAVKRGESLILTDPKSELYESMSEYLRDNGYTVKVFNLIEMDHSDSWNCLNEVGSSELMAQTFADIVLQNTSGDSKDAFWYNAELNLLKALVLYVALEMPPEQRNLATVYDLLYTQTEKGLSDIMASISHEHVNQYTGELLPPSPAAAPYAIFKQSSDTVRTSVIIGLGSKLAVLQAQQVRNITSYNEIDLELPGKQKCAYFCIVSDQDSTFDFLSSLFFSFLFIRLIRYADGYCEGGMLSTKVKFVLDEFPNCCLCSATRFLRNRDRIVEKKSPILRSISEARSLASTAPQTRGAAHARGRAFLGSGRSGFRRPSLCLLPSCGGLPFRLLVRAFCGLLGPFLGLHGLGVLRPAIDAGLPYVPVDVGRPLLAVVGNLRALAVCVMRPEGLHPVGELLERVADLCPHGGRLRGFSVLPGVGDVMDGAVELPLVLDDVARLAPPILIPGDKELGIFCDGGVVELLGLGRFDEHELGDGLGGLTPLLSVRDGLDGLLRC